MLMEDILIDLIRRHATLTGKNWSSKVSTIKSGKAIFRVRSLQKVVHSCSIAMGCDFY